MSTKPRSPSPSPSLQTEPKSDTDYTQWSHGRLISRISELESQLKAQSQSQCTNNHPSPHHHHHQQHQEGRPRKTPPKRIPRPIDPSKYSTRHIALKLAYLGQKYNGFEYHPNCPTPLPTVEEVLWRALRRARLIFPSDVVINGDGQEEISWEGCEYSKCGRTDRGVSAFGQVVGIRVRSNRPLARGRRKEEEEAVADEMVNGSSSSQENPLGVMASNILDGDGEDDHSSSSFDPIEDEIPYPYILNRILPENIRILAWCPSPPPDFSARFSCKERQYRYFFTQPAYAPIPGLAHFHRHISIPGWLDLDAMRKAARSFIGLHDFRNFCKVDPSKQITNFERRIYHADIIELGPARAGDDDPIRCISNPPRIYAFVVHGSAFLWHQVRQMVAILFLVGQGLESPSVVSELLDITRHPCRPIYEMADDAPLVLWDCIFPRSDDPERKDALEWIYAGDQGGVVKSGSPLASEKYGRDGLMEELWSVWRRRKMDEILMGSLLDVVADRGQRSLVGGQRPPYLTGVKKISPQIFAGGNTAKATGTYIPIFERRTLETVEEINRRYFRGKDQGLGEGTNEQQGNDTTN